MGFTDPAVEGYLRNLIPPRDAVLEEIESIARAERIPIVGPLVGRVLDQLARLVDAGRVFEMGSAVGYSTIWWARAVGPAGKVYYTDGSPANADRAKAFIERAGVADRVEILTGDSIELLDRTPGEFDVIFNDVDKHQYPEVFRHAADRVRVGGLLVADNVLWSGRVADSEANDSDTKGIREFNRLVYEDSRYMTTVLPLRDGVMVALRIE